MEFFCYHRDRSGSAALRERSNGKKYDCVTPLAISTTAIHSNMLGSETRTGRPLGRDATSFTFSTQLSVLLEADRHLPSVDGRPAFHERTSWSTRARLE
jgi:hypothetical protein